MLLRQRMLLVVVFTLAASTLQAEIPTQLARGTAWIDFTASGIHVRLDRAVDGFPDTVVDDEYFLMMNAPLRVGETVKIADAEVWSTADAVEVLDFEKRHRYRLTNGNEDPRSSADRARRAKNPGDDGSPSLADIVAQEDLLDEHRFEGYGLRHSVVKMTEAELIAWRNSPATDVALCTAGEPCASGGCSVQCSETSSCSVSCNNQWWNACCICSGAKKLASCTCVACNTY